MPKRKIVIPLEPAPLWERQPWDTDMSYAAFRLYLGLPRGERSVLGAYRAHRPSAAQNLPKGKVLYPPNTWWHWSRANRHNGEPIDGAVDWATRARAFDDDADAKDKALWEQRRQELRQREWDTASQLLDRANRMLTAVLFRRTVELEDGKQITYLEPTKWEESDIGRTLKLAFDLQRRAAALPTENVQVSWEQELARSGIDPKRALDQAISAILADLQNAPATDE